MELVLGFLRLLKLLPTVVPRLLLEVAVVVMLQPVVVLVLDMLNDKLGRLEGLVADLADVLLALGHLLRLVETVLVLRFDEQFILLRVLQLLLRATLEQLFRLLDVILLEEPC